MTKLKEKLLIEKIVKAIKKQEHLISSLSSIQDNSSVKSNLHQSEGRKDALEAVLEFIKGNSVLLNIISE